MHTIFALLFYLICPLSKCNSHIGPIFNARLHTFQRTSRHNCRGLATTKNTRHSKFIFSTQSFPLWLCCSLFIKPQDDYVLLLSPSFFIKPIIKFYIQSRPNSSIYTLCKLSVWNTQWRISVLDWVWEEVKGFECTTTGIY